MSGTKLTPEKITSPFQLMAAWFSMLVLVASVLLTAAANISKPEWAPGYLVIFTSVVIVLVIGCVTLMLTVFRPHLQDGKEYAQWLKDKNTYSSGIVLREQIVPKPRIERNQRKTEDETATDNKNCSISVSNIPGAIEVVQSLVKARFSAEVYQPPIPERFNSRDKKDHEAIWVGYRVPSNEAIEAIKIVLKEWPHLRYMHLSNDGGEPPDYVHDQMFFGGATSTAKDKGLSPWTSSEVEALNDKMTQEEFHRAIRRKYS